MVNGGLMSKNGQPDKQGGQESKQSTQVGNKKIGPIDEIVLKASKENKPKGFHKEDGLKINLTTSLKSGSLILMSLTGKC